MGFNAGKVFSLLVLDTDYFNDMQNKIELVGCDKSGIKCKANLAIINNNFLESERLRRDKNYPGAIDKLKSAFYQTTEINDKACHKCSLFYRNTITESLLLIKGDLKKLTSGFFANQYYKPSYNKVEEVLQELEKVPLSDTKKTRKSKEHTLNSYPRKIVS